MKHILLKLTALTLLISLSSCDKDFADIESDVKGAQNFNVSVREFPVTAFSKNTGPVQVNGLPYSYLGVLKDNTYNTQTTANIITEITPTTFNPDFGENPRIKRVILNIPYFSTLNSTSEDGEGQYTLDSIFGNQDVTYKLTILKSNYLLRDLDPATNFEEPQRYYSDFYTNTLEAQDDSYTVLYTIDDFKPNSSENVLFELGEDGLPTTDIKSRFSPGLFLNLLNNNPNDTTNANKQFWNDLLGIVEDTDPATDNTQTTLDYLSNANNFKAFFRGLIFKVEATNADGSLIALNLANTNAGITVDFTNNAEDAPGFVEDIRNPSEYNFGFNGIRLNTFTNTPDIATLNANEVSGDDNLFLRGFNGNFAVIDLFGSEDFDGNGISDELENFKSFRGKWLINEANLTFFVDNSQINNPNGKQPNRVVLYDLKNNLPIIDYFFDSTSTADANSSRTVYSVPLTRNSSGEGVKYKIRLTEHMNNILLRDSTNVKLGLYVTNNINNLGTSQLKTPVTVGLPNDQTIIEAVPQNTVLNNKGTVLYGTSSNVPEDKKVKFEIYYTEEN
ncbi:DUF4270 domain-containing protein [Aurantibacter aestuarii]|nr:DUF4270 domain-containing protein [Aurantibacter aestuarii]